jgi:hypothetical protein
MVLAPPSSWLAFLLRSNRILATIAADGSSMQRRIESAPCIGWVCTVGNYGNEHIVFIRKSLAPLAFLAPSTDV